MSSSLNGGITRYEHGRFTTLTTADGLLDDHPRALLEDSRGDLWIGSVGGLSRRRNDCFTYYSEKDGLPHPSVLALAEDADGGLWSARSRGSRE